MAIAKCRLEAWNPVLGGNETNKWVVAQTPENRNAVVSVYVFDKLANPRNGEVVISNRAKNFASATGEFPYTYKDNDGATVHTNSTQRLNRGVLTNFFRDFQFIRLVDEYSNQVLFAGRILSITEQYDARKGQLLKLKVVDALYELTNHSLKGLCRVMKFFKGSSGQSFIDVTKALIGLLYKKERLYLEYIDKIEIGSPYAATNDLIEDTLYYPPSVTTQYKTNIVTDDTGTQTRNRFMTTSMKLPSDLTIEIPKMKKKGILGELLSLLANAPQEKMTMNETFGWDYFVDPNISYGSHADFRGKNLDPATKPPPQMFNAFPRGGRIFETNPATYGLAIKYAASDRVISQGHKTIVLDEGFGTVPQYATKPMSIDFDFTRPKEELYSSCLLKYNDAGLNPNVPEDGEGVDHELALDIIYVTEISGHFKYSTLNGSGDLQEEEGLFPEISGRYVAGATAIEWLGLFEYDASEDDNAGDLIATSVAQIQYQSHETITGANNYGYILISKPTNKLLNIGVGANDGKYVLKGVGKADINGGASGTGASDVTCVVNLAATVANEGYPRRVWGMNKQLTLSKGAAKSKSFLRQEVASRLSRSSLDIVDGSFSISGPPMYHWDGEIRSVLNVTGGQQVSFQNAQVHANGDTPGTLVELYRYGFREGMVIAKMNSSYTKLAQTSGGRDIYGYCFGVPLDASYQVKLIADPNDTEVFAPGDKVRCFIPLRAGDTVRVENIVTNIQGNHLIKEISYTEEPNQMTRLKTTGVNEGFGLDNVGFQAALAGFREESDLTMNIPKGHQIAVWTGLFSAVDVNTVQWQTVGGEAKVILADGTEYDVDTATTSNNNTTDAAGEDSSETRFGLATAPGVGDDTVYYIYLDPNHENVPQNKEGDQTVRKHHFYTRPATTPETGSDPIYKQDGDNIIIGWMKAGATAGDFAEFGVYRDSKPGEGKRNAALVSHAGTATSALLKKGAQTFTTDLMIEASTWANDLARREVKWHGGTKLDGTEDAVNASIKMADGDVRTISAGGDSGDTGSGSYTYTSTGLTGSYSSINNFDDNKTYYAFIDFKENATGNMILRWTDNVAVPYGDDRVLLSMIVIPADNTKGRAPLIFPLTTKSLSVNAVVIAANSITGDHVQANTIATGHITGRIAGDKVEVNASTTFSAGYDPIDKITTFVQTAVPTALTSGDIWFDSDDDNKCYLATNAGDNQIGNGEWIYKDVNGAKGTADSKTTTFAQDNIPTSVTIGDIWIDTNDDNKVYRAASVGANEITSGEWVLYDLNNARAIAEGKIQTFIQGLSSDGIPTAITAGDMWLDSDNDYKSYLAASAGADQINAQEWVHYDFGLARATADTKRTTFNDSVANDATGQNGPVAVAIGDVWINTHEDSSKIYMCASIAGTKRVIGTNWVLRDDAGAINNATTNITGGRIETQAIILKAGGAGNPNNDDSVLSTAGVSNNGAGASRVVLSNTGIYGWNSSSAEGFSMRIDGAAHFGGDIGGTGGGFIDRTGFYVTDSNGRRVSWMKGDAGLVTGEGYNSGIDFRDLAGNNVISVWMFSDTDESSTYGSHSHGAYKTFVYGRDYLLTSLNQDMGLSVDSTYGKIGIYAGNSSPRPLVFMDSTSDDILHSSTNGYVGFTKRTGEIRLSGTTTRSTIYRLPWKNGTGGPTSSGNADKVLALVDNGSGSGTQTNPYVFDLKWVAQSGGGGGSGTVTEVTVGTGLDVTSATSTPNITLDLSELIDMTSDVVGTSDELILLDNGAERRKRISEITLSDFNNDLGWTSNTGSGTVASGNTGYVAYYTGSTTTGTKVTGGIQYVDNSNIALHANLTMSGYDITFGNGGYINFSHYQSGIKWEDGYGSEVVTLDVPFTVTSSYTFTLPPDSGTSGEVLSTDGSGNTSWVSNSGGGTIDGSGTSNKVAYWTDTDTLAATSSSSTYADLYVNDIRFIGSNPYCGTSSDRAYQVYTERLYSDNEEVFHENLSTSTSSTNYLKIHNSTGKLIESGSSRSIKENIVDLTIDTSKLYDLVPRSFKFKDQIIEVFNDETEETTSYTEIGENSFGMIAEEVHEILPNLVVYNKNNEPKSIDYPLLSVLLLAELKKLKTRIEILEGK